MPKSLLTFAVTLAVAFAAGAVESGSDETSELNGYFARLEERVLEESEIPLKEYGSDKFPQEITRSQNLAESGKYLEAAAVLSALLEVEMASDWRAMLTTRVEILKKWAESKKIELSDYRRFYLDTGPQWFRKRAKPIVALWKMNSVDETQKLALLRDLLRKRGDTEGEQLVLKTIATSRHATSDDAANALLEIGNQHYQSGDYGQAEAVWLKVREQFPTSAAWAKAVFNLGVLHKEKGEFPQAIHYFEQLLKADVNDLEPGGHIMEAYRNHRPRSQWEIGNCLFAQKKYREALEAYRLAETKYPFRSWCGTCQAGYRYRYAFYQGLCYDWLGEPATAVRLYCKAIRGPLGPPSAPEAYLRIVDLYEAAGQREALGQLLDAIDQQHLAEVKRHMKGEKQIDDQKILKSSPSRTMRRVLELRQMEAAEDWHALIGLLKIKGTVAGPDEAHARRGNWEAVEAARLLAKHSKATVPLLIARLERADRQDVKWVYYALGRCGTEEAVEALKANALKETNCWWTNAVIYALSLAGERGDIALRELAKVAEENLKGSIQRYREGRIGDRDADITFPEPKNIPSLPKTPDVEQRPSWPIVLAGCVGVVGIFLGIWRFLRRRT